MKDQTYFVYFKYTLIKGEIDGEDKAVRIDADMNVVLSDLPYINASNCSEVISKIENDFRNVYLMEKNVVIAKVLVVNFIRLIEE